MNARGEWDEPEDSSAHGGLTLPDATTLLLLSIILAFVFGILVGHALPPQFDINP